MGGSFVHTNLIPKETNNKIAVTIIIIIIIMKSQHSEGNGIYTTEAAT